GRAVRVHAAFDAYLLESAGYLRIELSPWYVESLRTSDLAGLTSPFVLIGLYLTHSYAVLCEIVTVPAGEETILFTHWLGLLSKLGLVAPPDDDWLLAGRLSSLPGALFFQYGWQGVIAGGAVLGAASGLSARLFRSCPGLI